MISEEAQKGGLHPSAGTTGQSLLDVLVILAVSSAFYLFGLGGRSFENHDHEIVAVIANNMLQSRDWLVMHAGGGKFYANKPHLLFWIICLFSLPAGKITPLTARLPCALGAAGCCAVAYLFARRIFDRRTAWLAAFMLMTTWVFSWDARRMWFDIPLTFFVLLAMFFLFWGYKSERTQTTPLFYLAAGVAIALAFLIKGPLGILWTIVPFVIFLILERKISTQIRYLLFMLFPVVVLLGVWLFFYVRAVGADTLFAATSKEMISHLSDKSDQWVRQPFFYYFLQIPADFVPWSIFFPATGLLLFRLPRGELKEKYRFLLVWVFSVIIMLSIPYSKTSRYALPIYPPMAMLVSAACIARMDKQEQLPLWLRRFFDYPAVWPALGMSAVIAGALVASIVVPDFRFLLAISAVFLLLLLPLLFRMKAAGPQQRFILAVALMTVFMLYLSLAHVQYLLANDDFYSPMKVMHREFSDAIEEDRFSTYRVSSWALDYYSGVLIRKLGEPEELETFLDNPRPVFCMLREAEAMSLPERVKQKMRIVDKTRLKSGTTLCIISNASTDAVPEEEGRPAA